MAPRTAHGVPMSARQARLWAYIRERRIGLADFATDDMVEAAYGQLVAAAAEVAKRRAAGDTRELRQLADDLAALMRRRPAQRLDGGLPAAGADVQAADDGISGQIARATFRNLEVD